MAPSLPISAANASHYTWGERCDGWHLVQADGLSVIHERMPAGTAEVRHRHERARQFFFVLRGTLCIELDGVFHRLAAGEGLEIPPGLDHQVTNEGPGNMEMLVISQPPSHSDRILSGARPL